jgi:hyperosmotically inducible protein
VKGTRLAVFPHMRMVLLATAIAAAFGGGACKSKPDDRADNTAQNQRDKTAVPTADQAGQTKPDVDIAQQIRKAIVDDSTLSTNAHNCKVIVKDGIVTLAGPVANSEERNKLGSLARGVPGASQVVNQLEILN